MKLYALAIAIFAISCSQPTEDTNEIFNGKTLEGWKVLGGDATFSVEDGMIVGTTKTNTGNTFLCTGQEYGDFVLTLDFKIEDTANNSGVMMRSHFDSAGKKVYGRQVEIDPSSRRWSAGIYDEARRGWLYPLPLNTPAMDAFKADEFNNLKIECIGNETKTWLNGKPVAYVVDTVDNTGFIALQVHAVDDEAHAGKKVYFKNINLDTKPSPASFGDNIFVVNMQDNQLTGYEQSNGWKLLFDGKTSAGWRSARSDKFPGKGWAIENGTLSVLSSQGKESANGGDIITTDKYGAFDLSFSFKISPGGNSGVKYFVTLQEKTDGSAIGLEYQLLDDSLHPDAKFGIAGNRTLASLYDLIKAEKQERFIKPPGEWNQGRIVVHPDNRVEHFLNGVKVLEYVRGSEDYRKLVARSKYKVWPAFGEAKEGFILLQDHGDAVSFKNIKIRRL
ncbi:MAG: DUF1080 domain-containing protein [Chitinophagaceae bacterium]|nr:DUF1080 domain-containing protein [Chitinophagaceae bacterium]